MDDGGMNNTSDNIVSCNNDMTTSIETFDCLQNNNDSSEQVPSTKNNEDLQQKSNVETTTIMKENPINENETTNKQSTNSEHQLKLNNSNLANLTISTKLSTDMLINKSPDLKLPLDEVSGSTSDFRSGRREKNAIVYVCVLQMLFGLLMIIFGAFVVVHNASLAQVYCGVWSGLVAIAASLAGLAPSAKAGKKGHQARTFHLGLSLAALGFASLALALAATGVVRDSNRQVVVFIPDDSEDTESTSPAQQGSLVSTTIWGAVLSGLGLSVCSGCQIIVSCVAVWKGVQYLCGPLCTDKGTTGKPHNPKHMLVSAWLGKHQISPLSTSPPVSPVGKVSTSPLYASSPVPPLAPVYVVSSLGRSSRSSNVMPTLLYAVPSPPPMMHNCPPPGYLMPPHAHRRPRRIKSNCDPYKHYRYPSDQQIRSTLSTNKKERRMQRPIEEKPPTEADVVKTYTGLDRTIAEEFIEHCDQSRTLHSLGSNESGVDTSLSINSDHDRKDTSDAKK